MSTRHSADPGNYPTPDDLEPGSYTAIRLVCIPNDFLELQQYTETLLATCVCSAPQCDHKTLLHWADTGRLAEEPPKIMVQGGPQHLQLLFKSRHILCAPWCVPS